MICAAKNAAGILSSKLIDSAAATPLKNAKLSNRRHIEALS